VFELPESLDEDDTGHTLPADQEGRRYFICSQCDGMARPTIQWFGEPYTPGTLDLAGRVVAAADVVLFIGTSGRTQAVRWLLHEAHWAGRAYTVIVDIETDRWLKRDGTPSWPGKPLIDAVLGGEPVLQRVAALVKAVRA
jgi:NAD-dependent SIR2 family protein deacetylase